MDWKWQFSLSVKLNGRFAITLRATTGYVLEKCFDVLTARMRARVGARRGLTVLPFIGYGNDERLFVHGRVLRQSPKRIITDENLWTNILATYQRLASLEVPNVRVRVTSGSSTVEAVTDEEGFFHCEFNTNLSPGLWHEVEFELLEVSPPIKTTGRVFIPSSAAAFGIISDIDDTVIVSHATDLLKLVQTVFLQSARERVAFPGVGSFYRALSRSSNTDGNPIFYVSSGPWNLYDLILDFLELNAIPTGPIFLQDFGFDRQKFLCASHGEHKLAQIQKIMDTYPALPFVLIGDSGQEDAEIYRKVLEQVPNRIRAIYIRDVAGDKRDAQVQALAEKAREHGGELLLVRDSLEAARHAASRGLISADALPGIAEEVAAQDSIR